MARWAKQKKEEANRVKIELLNISDLVEILKESFLRDVNIFGRQGAVWPATNSRLFLTLWDLKKTALIFSTIKFSSCRSWPYYMSHAPPFILRRGISLFKCLTRSWVGKITIPPLMQIQVHHYSTHPFQFRIPLEWEIAGWRYHSKFNPNNHRHSLDYASSSTLGVEYYPCF